MPSKADDEVWAHFDIKLTNLIPDHLESFEEHKALVVRGQFGFMGLIKLMEHLAYDRHIGAAVFEGKIKRLCEAIDAWLCCLKWHENPENYGKKKEIFKDFGKTSRRIIRPNLRIGKNFQANGMQLSIPVERCGIGWRRVGDFGVGPSCRSRLQG
ncbi:hypothetical protein MPER_11411, partial [Moniliophthora perniciosa FA553]